MTHKTKGYQLVKSTDQLIKYNILTNWPIKRSKNEGNNTAISIDKAHFSLSAQLNNSNRF